MERIILRSSLTLMASGMLLLLAYPAGAQTPFAPNPFTDVPTTHANFEAIEYLRINNIVRGYLDGTFRADARINRAEFLQIVTNPFLLSGEQMHDCVATNTSSDATSVFFPDVSMDAWYAEQVCIGHKRGLIDGYPDGKFRSGQTINVAEAAKIIASVFILNVATEAEVWYQPYLEKLGEVRALPVTIDGLSRPLTRGEMAEMLFRLKTQRTNKSTTTCTQLEGRW